ncbi:hypothetical protein WG68_05990 [Arsukibacterium ikkense]|uniref:DUF5009 domain-containing protein n=1 Tax=Arsukibacterium ikkense TaxID=336831 RepID=A0A0M2VAZ8_9GAMM|nr:DUF5009 domain-containing protein [Arsukibacterium ikkense]KKO46318.1 hypothetical protein WG68_05990 [Arsukibacterium ikkense]
MTSRFYALDALRGLAIALMVLVNTPGSWSHVYPALLHADWHGFTPADLVFPLFLFAVGAAMAFSMQGQVISRSSILKIARRTLLLLSCGLLLHWFAVLSLSELRLPGVLQRIALCYALAALLILSLNQRGLLLVTAGLLLSYWLLLLGFASTEPYVLNGNAVQQFDLWLLGAAHLYQGYGAPFDPEGLLSTLPAISSTLIGYLVARQLQRMSKLQGAHWLAYVGTALLLLGLLWQFYWPINKALWTGSYVVFSSGLILLLLALLVYILDVRQQRWLQPLVIYGTNPLFIYMLSWLWAVAASKYLLWQHNGMTLSLYQAGYNALVALLPAQMASLLFALLHVLLFWWLSLWLYRRRIFIRL